MAVNNQVTSSGMQGAAGLFVGTKDEVYNYLKNLQAELVHLRTQWDGQAAQVFEGAMLAWDAECKNILNHLDVMADQMITGANLIDTTNIDTSTDANFFNPGV